MKYRHTLKFDYPNDPHGHMIDPKLVYKDNLDKDYPYYNKSLGYKFVNVLCHVFMVIIFCPFFAIQFGLKCQGFKKIKKNKELNKNGFITVSNHIAEKDYLFIRRAMSPKRGHVLLWYNNHLRSLGPILRASGSIPVPRQGFASTMAMMKGVDNCLKDGKWIQIYPEGSMWFYYQDGVREFIDGAAMFACRNNKPIVPLAFSYRPAKGLYKLWLRKGTPAITITAGDPIYPNNELPLKERITDLNNRAHDAVDKLRIDNTPDVEE